MKKLLVILSFMLFGLLASAQVTKLDFDALLTAFPASAYEYVYLSNYRTYYTDGTNSLTQAKYYANKMTIEPKEHAVYLKFYDSTAKTNLNDIMIIPYNAILSVEAYKTAFVIDMLR